MCRKQFGPNPEQKPSQKDGKSDNSAFTSVSSTAKGGYLNSRHKEIPNSRYKEVRLQTAVADLKNPKTDTTVSTRIILDNGSDRTYISKEMVEKLKVEPIDLDVLSIHKLNQKKHPEDIESPVVAVELMLKNHSSLRIFANVLSPVVGHI